MSFDPRVTPARPDLASIRLKGQVEAERFAEPHERVCLAPAAAIRRAPAEDAGMDDQLLFGGRFDVYEEKDGWAWGQSRTDFYVGYVRADQLSDIRVKATHRVSALRTYAFSKPDLKSRPAALLSMNCRIADTGEEGSFLRADSAGWIFQDHLAPLDADPEDAPADIAQRFVGTPYLWGGKESLGLDCSGLVQMAMGACGVECPRDADMQEAALGAPVAFDESLSGLQRGDLVFWPGHVGMMVDGANLVHATAHFMATVIEPLAEARDRIAAAHAPIRTIKRLG